MKQPPSAETDCRIPLKELKAWSVILEGITHDLDAMDIVKTPESVLRAAMSNARFTADFLRDKIERHIKEDVSVHRLTEDAAILDEQKELMRLRRPEWDKEQYQALIERTERKERTDEKKK
jgi:hypothetical protein